MADVMCLLRKLGGQLWKAVESCGKLWKAVESCGKLWKAVESCGNVTYPYLSLLLVLMTRTTWRIFASHDVSVSFLTCFDLFWYNAMISKIL